MHVAEKLFSLINSLVRTLSLASYTVLQLEHLANVLIL